MLAAGHRRHDPVPIAAMLDRGRRPGPAIGRALLAACTDCARLHADLVLLVTTLPVATTPSRTRDFTLTMADAERLHARGLRRWLRSIGTSRDAITRPLALGFTTLGLAGLLIATVPGVLPGILNGAGGAAVSATTTPQLEMQTLATPAADLQQAGPDHGDAASRTSANDPGVSPVVSPVVLPVVALSVVFLAAGGGLFVARRAARDRSMR